MINHSDEKEIFWGISVECPFASSRSQETGWPGLQIYYGHFSALELKLTI